MTLFDALATRTESICVVGLGYVGLPLAVFLSKRFSVIGFDINGKRIEELAKGHDTTDEVNDHDLQSASIIYTTNPEDIAKARFIIVAVPTPVDHYLNPDLTLVEKASEMVGSHLSPGSIVVYESTVYPGVTEDICVPILERFSRLRAGVDFFVGYSPERVNPGDKEHTIDRVTKVVSGMDDPTLDCIASVYGAITTVFRARSIRVAEAAKVIENTQRDLNIALMNELAVLFHALGISVYDVLDAAKTKWNFLPFSPGLVGGHCIGVDPYYLTYKAKEVGYEAKVILAGRGINDSMHKFIAEQIVKEMVKMGKTVRDSRFVILGMPFKENVPDIRNSKVAELYKELKDFGVNPLVYDPIADKEEVAREYGIPLAHRNDLVGADTLILAVAHDVFRALDISDLKSMMNNDNLLFADIKHLFERDAIESQGIHYWTL